MTLEILQNEMITAMKSGNKYRKTVISGLIAQIKKAAIDKGCRDNISEEMINAELIKAKKQAQESIDTCPESRVDLLEAYNIQMAIICEFAPRLITDEDYIRALITGYASSAGIKLAKSNRGAIMKFAAANLKGKADMGIVNKVVAGMLK